MVALQIPTFHVERALLAEGFSLVAGTDEVGAGCLAGPVFAAAVILPFDSRIGLIRDSKLLSSRQRERTADRIVAAASAWAVGAASAEEIDLLNVRQAAALAMRRAIGGLKVRPQCILVDGLGIGGLDIPTRAIVKGDRKVKSIAAASIIAKVARDRHMRELDADHPGYGFAVHKGYATRAHKEALRRLGPCEEHRRSFAPVRSFS